MVNYFDKELALFHAPLNNQRDIFKMLSDELLKQGLVTDAFLENILKREESFPTGLFINGIGVAIPHTDNIYVKRSQIAFMSLKETVPFFEMGTNSNKIDVQLIFMLALKESHEQLSALQTLIDMFQKEGALEQFLAITSKEQFIELIHNYNLL